MSLDTKLILGAIGKLFDDFDARWERRLPKLLTTQEASPVISVLTPTVAVGAAVIADNWGGGFNGGEYSFEQYCAAPSIVADNWGGFFGGEDATTNVEFAIDPPGDPERFVLPNASTNEPSIDPALDRTNSGVADDSINALVTSTDPNALLDAVPADTLASFTRPEEGRAPFFHNEISSVVPALARLTCFTHRDLAALQEFELMRSGSVVVHRSPTIRDAASRAPVLDDWLLKPLAHHRLLGRAYCEEDEVFHTMPTRCSTLVPTPTTMAEIVYGAQPRRQTPPSVSAAARKAPDDLELGLPDYYGAGSRHPLTSRVVTLLYCAPELLLGSNSPEAKALLEAALMEANRERKKHITGTMTTKPNDDDNLDKDDDELCLGGICLELACTVEVQDCRHQMYVAFMLALCFNISMPITIAPSAILKMAQPDGELLVSVGVPGNALVLKVSIQGVVAALHRETLQGTSLNEEQMKKDSIADICHRQLNKILADLDQDHIIVRSSCLDLDSSGESRDYGFVQFEMDESAQSAIDKLYGMLLNDKKVYIGFFCLYAGLEKCL
jgi:hypothetical protein